MDEESFNALVEEAEKREFETEEEAKAFFDSQLKEYSRLKLKKRKVKVDEREATDPYYAMLKTEKPIESRYLNQWDLSDEDYHRYMDEVERNIGRYPEGYRHYENYENYKVANPEASIQDYHNESKLTINYNEWWCYSE